MTSLFFLSQSQPQAYASSPTHTLLNMRISSSMFLCASLATTTAFMPTPMLPSSSRVMRANAMKMENFGLPLGEVSLNNSGKGRSRCGKREIYQEVRFTSRFRRGLTCASCHHLLHCTNRAKRRMSPELCWARPTTVSLLLPTSPMA